MASRRDPKRAPDDAAASLGDGSMEVGEFGGPSQLESVSYILAMTKPLIEIAKARGLRSLVYYLEMAVLDAADIEIKLKSLTPPERETRSDPDA